MNVTPSPLDGSGTLAVLDAVVNPTGRNATVSAQVVAPGVVRVAVQQRQPVNVLGIPHGPQKPELYFFVVRPEAFPASPLGYALGRPAAGAPARGQDPAVVASLAARADAGAAAPAKAASAVKASATTKATSSSRDLAFLDSKTMSIEDKIMSFMAYVQKKTDAELVEKMKDYQAKKAAEKVKKEAEAQKDDGGGLFGFVGDVVGGVVGAFESVVKTVGGPLLAAGVSAMGMPFLAPAALQFGGQLGVAAVDSLAGAVGIAPTKKSTSAATKAGTSEKAASSTGGSEQVDDQLAMLELQRLMQKQERMYAAMSNVLKSIHDGQMVAIQNVK